MSRIGIITRCTAALATAVLVACVADYPVTDSGTGCNVVGNQAWFYAGDSVHATLPKCPIKIAKNHTDTVIRYSIFLYAPPQESEYDGAPGPVDWYWRSAAGAFVDVSDSGGWFNEQGDLSWVSIISGTYDAGTAGKLTDTTKMADTGFVSYQGDHFSYLYGNAHASVIMPYSYSVKAKMTATSTALVDSIATVSASAENYYAPLSATWLIDGTEVTGLANVLEFQFTSGSIGTHTYQVTLTDADGDAGTDNGSTFFSNPGGGGGGGGDDGGGGCYSFRVTRTLPGAKSVRGAVFSVRIKSGGSAKNPKKPTLPSHEEEPPC